ncbi:MAG TPA: hypothetical protein VNA88_16920 [Candidatus Kapabacteria bacterium]|jgi:hypothetical protein|nr:hypothetical protein [Candidatus Kapabacteria bacterium]
MNRTVRIILAVVGGIVAGSIVNMGLIQLGSQMIPAPAGVDITTTEGLRAAMGLFEPRHFIFPFLAHALGTLFGAFVATWIAGDGGRLPAYIVGGFFLLGGIASAFMIPAPAWFIAVDLIVAYIPMALLGAKLAPRRSAAVASA